MPARCDGNKWQALIGLFELSSGHEGSPRCFKCNCWVEIILPPSESKERRSLVHTSLQRSVASSTPNEIEGILLDREVFRPNGRRVCSNETWSYKRYAFGSLRANKCELASS